MESKNLDAALAAKNTATDGAYIMAQDANGNTVRIAKADLASVLAGIEPTNSIEDGVFIMCHRNSDGYPLAIKPSEWASYQNDGQIAEGVLVIDGTEMLVVAVEEASVLWSSANISAGGVSSNDRLVALADWEGKTNTEAQITHEECSGVDYAAGYCAAYSKTNANGQGLTAGRWWLPSLAQLMCMYSNKHKINYALSKINGARQITKGSYWSSTEHSANRAWYLPFSSGCIDGGIKSGLQLSARPVSAFLR